MPIKMVVGLGNPGKKYEDTRHNVGYRVIEALEKQPPIGAKLLKSTGYMNSAGLSVYPIAQKAGIEPSEILIVCDDFSLPLKRMRIRRSGSSGGHNGLQSVLDAFDTQNIPRLRVGIGPVPEGDDPAEFVLRPFRRDEITEIGVMVAMAADAARLTVMEGLDKAMNQFNPELDVA